jgi:peptide/nickel transport system substrate-binding protein
VATTAGHVVSKAYYDAHAAAFGKPEGGLLGTGPFRFASWKPGSEIVLERFDGYWDKAKGPFLDRLVFKIISEDAARVTGLRTGEIDATIRLPVELLPVVRSIKGAQLVGVEGLSDDWIAFNTKKKPFDDPAVRKAIITAFDLKSVMDNIVKDSGVAAGNQSVGPALWTFAKPAWENFQNTVEKYAYDPAKARELLSKSRGARGFKARILTDGDSFRVNVAQALQSDLKRIGIELEIEKVSEQELTTRQFSGKRDYDMVMGGWGADFPDPAANVQPFLQSSGIGDGGSDFAAYANPKVDALLDQQSRSSDDNERARLLISALQIAAADAPYIFVDHPKVFYAAREKVAGYTMSPIWYWDSIARGMYLRK